MGTHSGHTEWAHFVLTLVSKEVATISKDLINQAIADTTAVAVAKVARNICYQNEKKGVRKRAQRRSIFPKTSGNTESEQRERYSHPRHDLSASKQ